MERRQGVSRRPCRTAAPCRAPCTRDACEHAELRARYEPLGRHDPDGAPSGDERGNAHQHAACRPPARPADDGSRTSGRALGDRAHVQLRCSIATTRSPRASATRCRFRTSHSPRRSACPSMPATSRTQSDRWREWSGRSAYRRKAGTFASCSATSAATPLQRASSRLSFLPRAPRHARRPHFSAAGCSSVIQRRTR